MALSGIFVGDDGINGADGMDFAIIREGDGDSQNPSFRRHMMQAFAANIRIGCLHICDGNPEAEAKAFSTSFRPFVGKAVPFASCGDAAELSTFSDCVETALGIAVSRFDDTIHLGNGGCSFDGDAAEWDAMAALPAK